MALDRSLKITKAYGRAYDGLRKALLPPGTKLTIVEHVDGADDVTVAVFEKGWLPSPSKQAGVVEAKLRIQIVSTALGVVDPDEDPPTTSVMTLDMADRSHRLSYLEGGPTFVVTNYDRPGDAPLEWNLWCEELVIGAI